MDDFSTTSFGGHYLLFLINFLWREDRQGFELIVLQLTVVFKWLSIVYNLHAQNFIVLAKLGNEKLKKIIKK